MKSWGWLIYPNTDVLNAGKLCENAIQIYLGVAHADIYSDIIIIILSDSDLKELKIFCSSGVHTSTATSRFIHFYVTEQFGYY